MPKPYRQLLIGTLALIAAAGIVAVGTYITLGGSKGAPSDPATPDRAAHSSGNVTDSPLVGDDEPSARALYVTTTGSGGNPTTVIALEGQKRVTAERVRDGVHQFSPPPSRGAQLLAWAGSPESRGATGVADVLVYDGVKESVSMRIHPVWSVRVRLEGVADAPEGDPVLGLRFPTPAMAGDWARTVEIINGVPAGYYLRTPTGENVFDLPMLPEQVPLQVNAVWGSYAGVSETFELTESVEITLDLTGLPETRTVRVRGGRDRPVKVNLSLNIMAPGRPGARSLVSATGDDGVLRVPVEAGAEVSVRLADNGWVSPLSSYNFPPGADELEIQVWKSGSLSLRVEYDDGTPYVGMVSVSAAFPDLGDRIPRGWSGRLVDADTPIHQPKDELERAKVGAPSDFHEVITFTDVPLGLDLIVRLPRSRVGYSAHEETIPPAKSEAEDEILIIIPRDLIMERTPSTIKIPDHLRFADDVHASIIFLTKDGRFVPFDTFKLSERRESRRARPGSKYIVRLSGSAAWQSDEFELPPGTVYEVFPQAGAPVTITARVVDEQGEPIKGATLDINAIHGPPDPSHPRNTNVVIRESDADGRVSLVGQPRVKTDYRLEAPGYQPQVMAAGPGMEAEYDLGEIVLKKAVGEIHIRLPEANYEDTFVQALVHQYGSGNLATVRADSNVIIVRNLPVGRKYAVSLMPKSGRSIKLFNGVEPTEEEPVVELDATDIELSGS